MQFPSQPAPQPGDFVEVRARRWLIEDFEDRGDRLPVATLSCIDDDAQGEQLSVIWDAEIGARLIDDDPWTTIGRDGPDDAEVFAAFLRTLKWRTATAADRRLFQAPFRAGIRLDAYQLAPLDKALRLPRVNMLIADDVGLGKTIEAGLVMRELLLRRRIDYVLVAAPPSMTLQWQDELAAKFGLSFQIIDRDRLADLRRLRGFGVNPWSTGSRFLISHRLLTDETYMAGLRDMLGEFRPRALLILDEAHHAAPASGARYAIDSQFTKAVRDIAGRFEHRLFLTATPHNGHSNSFSSLLEMLDPQRFTRGVAVRAGDLAPVMIRRLKDDLRKLGESFPKRAIVPIVLKGLPETTPELRLARLLADYGELRARRIASLAPGQAARAFLAFSGLQQRLLSSVAAFAKTLAVHKHTLEKAVESADGFAGGVAEAAEAYARAGGGLEALALDADGDTDRDPAELEAMIEADSEAAAGNAARLGAAGADAVALRAELAAVDAMLAEARAAAGRPDARIRWLTDWIAAHLLDGTRWRDRRLIIFTEWEDTRRWLEKRLREALAHTDDADARLAVFSGMTAADTREDIKQRFNADPAVEPLRILLCTDAAREGVNLQTRCYDLVHFDLPWNPARLEQRNGRIDRKLQPAPEVYCRYFRYEQRPEDIVLDALVRKTEVIQRQLGSAGQVIAERIERRLTAGGIARTGAAELAAAIDAERDDALTATAREEMDDAADRRLDRVKAEIDQMRRSLDRARKRVGVDPQELQQVVGIALDRARFPLGEAEAEPVGKVETFALDPHHPAFAHDTSWQDAFDDLRSRRRRRGERVGDWRRDAPLRTIAFEPPVLPDNRNADNVVQVHLEHRLVRRLLGRFLSQGFQSGLNRAAVILGPGARPRVALIGRIALFGPGAARLHEEILPVTAMWTELGRGDKPLTPLGAAGEATTLDELEDALSQARRPSDAVVTRALSYVRRDVEDLLPALQSRARQAIDAAKADLDERGAEEARSLAELLQQQRKRIEKAEAAYDDRQLDLPNVAEAERRQKRADRRHWLERLRRLDRELEEEPARVRASFDVRAERLEPVGLVYLWPVTG
ncbi:MAG: ATP-dependent helicase [Alphaproteobacteria bacterium]|nr:ATP-dependent helicase [Alphaproteobacteria bacterium]